MSGAPEAGGPDSPGGGAPPSGVACRLCGGVSLQSFVDLGTSPLANAFVDPAGLDAQEAHYPLHAHVCRDCLLVQLPPIEAPEVIFSHYLYFSSVSSSWLAHSRAFAERMISDLRLGERSRVVEVGSNDGYLLRFFREHDVPILGIDPAANVAEAATSQGVETLVRFFGSEVARELKESGRTADLLIGNNVLAHVPDLHDFLAGLKIVLKPEGTLSLEFPHLLCLLRENQFDTIYHEHFSYFSLQVVERALREHGLVVADVEQLPTHGGSLRVLARHAELRGVEPTDRLLALRNLETEARLDRLEAYEGFEDRARAVKRLLVEFLTEARREGKSVLGYGAPAKGNTLLNYCGVRPELMPFTVDRSPHKQGFRLPGSRIPIRAPEAIRERKPDYLLILPWNLKGEIMEQMSSIRSWGGKFVVSIPTLEVLQ